MHVQYKIFLWLLNLSTINITLKSQKFSEMLITKVSDIYAVGKTFNKYHILQYIIQYLSLKNLDKTRDCLMKKVQNENHKLEQFEVMPANILTFNLSFTTCRKYFLFIHIL